MRALGPLVLFSAVSMLGISAGHWPVALAPVPPSGASAPMLAAPLAVAAPVPEAAPAPPRRRPARAPVATPPTDADQPRHEALAARAEGGNPEAALELAGMLEACAARDETRSIMHVIVADDGSAPECSDAHACAAIERLYDEFDRSLQGWRDAERDCAAVPEDWLDERGRWLKRAAELGDAEAMACYAVAGAELAPSPFHSSWAPWMEHWRGHAIGWAWQAWDRGEPRAALALARLYAPQVGRSVDAVSAGEPNPRLAFRFALLLTRALDLDPTDNDLAALVENAATQLTPSEFADEEAWALARLPALEKRLALPSRMPEDCWQHFAVFERAVDYRSAMR